MRGLLCAIALAALFVGGCAPVSPTSGPKTAPSRESSGAPSEVTTSDVLGEWEAVIPSPTRPTGVPVSLEAVLDLRQGGLAVLTERDKGKVRVSATYRWRLTTVGQSVAISLDSTSASGYDATFTVAGDSLHAPGGVTWSRSHW